MVASVARSVAAAPRAARLSVGRLAAWGGFACALIVAPLAFPSGLGVSMLSQVGIAIVACLSYNMLLGQGGMLSFGHAVYTGLGTFVAVHALLGIGDGSVPIPVSLIPLVGGVAGMFFAVILGYVTTKKAGTPFAMITLLIDEGADRASVTHWRDATDRIARHLAHEIGLGAPDGLTQQGSDLGLVHA